MLSKKLNGRVDLHNIKSGKDPILDRYDKVIIGGSIYIGNIQKQIKKFCFKRLKELKRKKVGLFICGMQQGTIMEAEFVAAFPPELLANSIAKESFGGEFIFKKMNPIERLIVTKTLKVYKDTSNISEESINRFAQIINNSQ
ncbi:protoporphyrinogen oxidase [Clostridium formicaceticum]|nr:protoporphyrinogen oxidase [Clostridium formicaceticum]